jgi:hypothetical protein
VIKKLMIAAFALIVLFGALPLLSALTASAVAAALGCGLDEGSIHLCMLWGRNIGKALYIMFVSGWFGMVTIPFACLAMIVWIVVAMILIVIAYRRRTTH